MQVKFHEYMIPNLNSGPYGITAGRDGAIWFTEQKGNRIGRITTDGFITEYPIKTANAEPHGIVVGENGSVWFAEECGQIGRLTIVSAQQEQQ